MSRSDHIDEVVIAAIDRLDLALPALAWNAHAGSPVFYVTAEGVPEATRRALAEREGTAYMYLFGPLEAIPVEVARELTLYGHVQRIPGDDPIELAVAFAAYLDVGRNFGWWIGEDERTFGWAIGEPGHGWAFANPDHWEDAVAGAVLSHRGKHGPLLLVPQAGLPEVVRRYLEMVRPELVSPREQLFNHAWILGPPEHVSLEVQAQVDAAMEPRRGPRAGQPAGGGVGAAPAALRRGSRP